MLSFVGKGNFVQRLRLVLYKRYWYFTPFCRSVGGQRKPVVGHRGGG